jgi:hypothetical protein
MSASWSKVCALVWVAFVLQGLGQGFKRRSFFIPFGAQSSAGGHQKLTDSGKVRAPLPSNGTSEHNFRLFRRAR